MLSCMVHNYFRKLNYWTSSVSYSRDLFAKMEKYNVRWAFNSKSWDPKEYQLIAASSYIQPEEKQRISRFVFQEDAKSSLIGRLMLRKYIHLSTSMPYEEIRFGRDYYGKPYLLGAGDVPVSFNVSHQGDFVVLAGGTRGIGVDVMKIEPPANKNVPEMFRLMNRQFSPREWSTIRSFPTEMEQIASFYRHWCLKESYAKNIGKGVSIPLDEISFSLQTRTLELGKMVTDTTLYVRNELKDEWVFEETLVDDKHAVAVSMLADRNTYNPVPYKYLNFEDLVKEAKPLFDLDTNFGEEFLKKKVKIF